MKMTKKRWTRDEDIMVMNLKKSKATNGTIGVYLDRTEKSVESRWRELRRGMGKRTSGGKIITTAYTEEDIALAKSLYDEGKYQWEIANILGRSESSVGNMLARMKKQEVI